MKTTKWLLSLTIIGVMATVSCKKEDNTSTSNISGIITAGTWRVSYYHESGDDHTSNFSGYTFTFNSNGTMEATNSSGTTSGTWRIDDDGSNEFHMSIGNSSPLKDLDHGWIVTSQSTTVIHLRDDDSSHDKELHFTKI